MGVYFLKSLLCIALVYVMAYEFSAHEFWLVPLSVFTLSVPICLAGLYALTIRKTQQAALFVQQGWLYRVFLGRTFKTVLWILWSLLSAFYMLVQFQFYKTVDWLLFFRLFLLFMLCMSCSGVCLRMKLKRF